MSTQAQAPSGMAGQLFRLCLALDASPAYRSFKHFFYNLLENNHARQKRYFDLFMIILVVLSIFLLIYDVAHPVPEAAKLFEDVVVLVFISEYLLRLWVYDDPHQVYIRHYEQAKFLDIPFRFSPVLSEVAHSKWNYISSPMAIIDLLAILPSYRPIRLLRIFLLFRLFKLFRYTRSSGSMATILAEKRFELYTLLLFLVFVLLASSSAIYLFEGNMPGSRIDSFFDAFYWSMITLSTVGYGDITPHTTEGQVIAIALVVSGLGLVAFTTSVIVAAFHEKLPLMRERHILSELERMKGYAVICGYGRVGQVVVQQLSEDREPFVIIDRDAAKVRSATNQGFLAIQGDAEKDELLKEIGIADRASRVVCVTGDDVSNLYVTISARQMNPRLTILARANRKQMVHKFRLAGADHVVAPFEISGLMGAEYVGKPVAFEAIYGIMSGDSDIALEAIPFVTDSQDCNCTLKELDIAAHKLLLYGVITLATGDGLHEARVYPLPERQFYFNPPGDYRLRRRDILVLVGHRYSLQQFRRTLEKL